MALKCLNQAHQISPEDPGLHVRLVEFRKALDAADEQPKKVKEVIKSCSKIVPTGSNLKSFNEEYAKKHAGSPKAVFSILTARRLLDGSDAVKKATEEELIKTLSLKGASLEDAVAGLAVLKKWKSGSDVVEKYTEGAGKVWKEATLFKA
jgi:hypothetical protein